VLHHVTLEVGLEAAADEARFWSVVGFDEVPVPEALGGAYSWFEHAGTQIHLMHTEDPAAPAGGHVAVVVPDFDPTVVRLREAGFEVRPGRELWGEKRAKALTPSGHTVELMAAPPAPAPG
jgi:catechol 2,3-dioxygenase-like lactoylglutathione lyase family enzyme